MARRYTILYDCTKCGKRRSTPSIKGLCYQCKKRRDFPYSCRSCRKRNAASTKGGRCKRCINKSYKAEHKFNCYKCGSKNAVTQKGNLCYGCSDLLVREGYAEKHQNLSEQEPKTGCLAFFIIGVILFMLETSASSKDSQHLFGILLLLAFVGWLIYFFTVYSKTIDLHDSEVQEVKANLRKEFEDKYKAKYKEEIRSIENAIGFTTHSGKGSSKSGKFYVYLHYHTEKKKIIYVGKGTNDREYSIERTVQEHVDLLNSGKIQVHRILDSVSESVAFEQESYLIELFGRTKDGGPLLNLQSGIKNGANHLPKHKGVAPRKFSATAEDTKLTIWLDEYIESKKYRGVSDYTLSRINTHLVRASEALNWTVVGDFDEDKLAAYLNSRELSERTHKNYLESWRAFLSFAESICDPKK
ncbi:hypothetical protein N8521_03010 [Akkermansiaceae bacterium]|nr:hypothetical protein [Akkermansiaceae bacterium]